MSADIQSNLDGRTAAQMSWTRQFQRAFPMPQRTRNFLFFSWFCSESLALYFDTNFIIVALILICLISGDSQRTKSRFWWWLRANRLYATNVRKIISTHNPVCVCVSMCIYNVYSARSFARSFVHTSVYSPAAAAVATAAATHSSRIHSPVRAHNTCETANNHAPYRIHFRLFWMSGDAK